LETCTRDILQALRRLANSTRGIVATSTDHQVQESIIERSHQVLECSTHLVREAKKAVHTPDDLELQAKLAELARDVSSALNACLTSMPSQRYLNDAIQQMSAYIYKLAGPFEKSAQTRSTSQLDEQQTEIKRAAAQLNQATTDFVVSTRAGIAHDLGKTSARFTRSFADFLDHGIELVRCQDDDHQRARLITSLKNVQLSSNRLFERAKTVTIELNQDNETKQELADAARTVTEHINDVLASCVTSKTTTETSIGQLECENARREMETSKIFLQQAVLQPCNTYTYYEALDQVVDNSKRLGEAMTHIASASKNTNHPLFKQAVQDVSKAVCRLAESSAQVK
jgi:talin